MFSTCQRISLSFARHKQYALSSSIATRFNNPSHGGFCMTVRPITHSMTATAFAIEGYRTTLLQHAHDLGATAVIGIQYDATEVMQGVTEVLCYGTAVVADRVQQ